MQSTAKVSERPFHGGNAGSNPAGDAKIQKELSEFDFLAPDSDHDGVTIERRFVTAFPYGIFSLRCHYCDHCMPLPRISPLGSYAGQSFRTADEVKSKQISSNLDCCLWPVEFACMTYQRLWPYSKEEIHKLEEEDQDYPALAEQSKGSVLWQLKIVEPAESARRV